MLVVVNKKICPNNSHSLTVTYKWYGCFFTISGFISTAKVLLSESKLWTLNYHYFLKMDDISKPSPMAMTVSELGTTGRRVAMKPKERAQFSAHYFLESPQNINWQLTIHLPRRWLLMLVLFNGTTSFLIEKLITAGIFKGYWLLQPFCQILKSTG